MKSHAATMRLVSGLFVAAWLTMMSAPAAAQAIKITGNIKGTLTSLAAGECPTGYPHQCSVGPCMNSTAVPTPKITGNFGNGTITSMCVSNGLLFMATTAAGVTRRRRHME